LVRYETKNVQPPADVLKRMADAFGVSIDYLVNGDTNEKAKQSLKDATLIKQFQKIITHILQRMLGIVSVKSSNICYLVVNFTNFLFEEINENDTLKVKTARFLLNVFLFHYVYGAGDWLPFTGRNSDIRNKILTHHPELGVVEE